MNPRLVSGLIVAVLATAAQADVYRMTYELGTARVGSPLKSSWIGLNNGPTCRDLCSNTPSCMAYTFKKNVTTTGTPNCFLYRSMDGASPDTNSISGQQDPTYYPLPQGMMNEAEFVGGDLGSRILLSQAHPEPCRTECTNRPGCIAFVYYRPGFTASGGAECQLKAQLGTLTNKACCIAGASPVADAGTPPPPATPDAGVSTPDAGSASPPDGGWVPSGPLALEDGVDRPGFDAQGRDIDTPAACRDLCSQQPSCAGFTYVRAGLQGPKARCFFKTISPAAKKDACCVSGVKGIATMSELEVDTDRPGADYRRFDVATEDARICRDACAKERDCMAFTLVRANVHGPSAYCTLKSSAPAPQRNNKACVSGVKQEWAMSPVEANTDRPGMDLSGRDADSAEACRTACARDTACKAFTFVNPGIHAPSGRCYFKTGIPNAVPGNTCCSSGVKW